MSSYVSEMDRLNTSTPTILLVSMIAETREMRGLITDEIRDLILEAINCYLLPVVFIFGLTGNMLSLIVLTCLTKSQSSTTILLIGLTISDMGFLVTTFMRKFSCISSKVDPARGLWLDVYFLPQVFMLNKMFTLTTAYVTMVISIERCLACYLPFKVGLLVTRKRMIVIVTTLFVVSLGLIFPLFFIYKLQWTPATSISPSLPFIRETQFFIDHRESIIAYNNIVISNVVVFFPMAVVTVCTVMVVQRITSSLRWRRRAQDGEGDGQHSAKVNLPRREELAKIPDAPTGTVELHCGESRQSPTKSRNLLKAFLTFTMKKNGLSHRVISNDSASKVKNLVDDNKKTTRMLIIIAIIYILCNIPVSLARLVSYIEPEFSSYEGRYTNSFLATFAFGSLLQCFNSSINFVIYVATGSKIGKPFRKMLPCLFKVDT